MVLEVLITGGIFYFHKFFFNPYIASLYLVIIYLIVVSIISIRKKQKYSWHILVGVLLLTISTGVAILDFLNIYRNEAPMMESFFIMILLFAAALASRFASVHRSLNKAHGDLLVLDKMKDDFLSTTTHELRTPLHGIMGIAESLADGSLGDMTMRQRESLDLIRLSAERLNGLVTSILDFSKLRAGRADLFIDDVALGEVITSVISLLEASAKGKEIEFRTDIGPLPKIRADRNRIYQVLINLVGNAIKFTERGTVTVRASLAGTDMVRVEVEDTGPGIAPEDLAGIWTPFTRGGDSDTRRSGGTGLGLAITKNLVELHGGTIRVRSDLGKGSVFIFEIPIKARMAGIDRAAPPQYDLYLPETAVPVPAADISAAAQAVEEPMLDEDAGKDEWTEPLAARRDAPMILAVDDDPVNLKVIENLCRPRGYMLFTAEDGPAALRIIETNDIDLVLLDLMLPGMSGYEVCREIRRMDKGRHTPIIMVTARDQVSDLANGFKTGASDYITKPFKSQELALRIENQLALKMLLDMEKSLVNGLRKEKQSVTGLLERTMDLKESALQMLEWEKIIRTDLGVARTFQERLMSHSGPFEGFEASVHYHPLMELGGDVCDIIRPRPGVLRVFLADATGHGISASLNTVKILTEYASVRETLGSPAEIMDFLNRRFSKQFKQYGIVFTCVIADVDMAASSVTVATAGMPPQMIRRGGETAVIGPTCPIIGLSDSVACREERHAMRRGDVLFLYSDGLIEMIDGRNRGESPKTGDSAQVLADALAFRYQGANLEESGGALLRQFGGAGNISIDDVTFIAVKITG